MDSIYVPSISDEEKDILNSVIDKLGGMTKNQIVSFMHKEQAYIRTPFRNIISFEHVVDLQI